MATNKNLQKLPDDQKGIALRVFDLVIGRVYKKAYLGMNKGEKKEMDEVFMSDDNGAKEKFIKKHIPNFKKLFKEEALKIEKEIKAEIKNKAKNNK